MKNDLPRQSINVDKENLIPLWTLKESDNVILKLALFKNSVTFDITGQTIRLGAKTTKGLKEQIDGFTIQENNLDIALKNTILIPGLTEIDLEFTDAVGKMTSASFYINVNQKVLNDSAVEATNEFDTFTKTVGEIQGDYQGLRTIMLDENNAANLQNQINLANASLEQKANKSNVESLFDDVDSQLADIAINPMKYNVVGDGVTDDTVNLQVLFDSVSDNSIILLNKNYKVSKLKLSNKKNIKFIGNGSITQSTTIVQNYTMQNPLSTEPMITLVGCENIVFEKGLNLFPVNEALYCNGTTKRVTFNCIVDGRNTSRFSGIFFVGDGLDFNGIIRNCGVLPIWNGTQNPYSTCNGLHCSGAKNIIVKGELYNNGMNGLYLYACSDLVVDKSVNIYGNGMSGIQIAFGVTDREQKRYKISGTIHDNYSDGIDINNTTSTRLSVEAIIDNTIQYNNGFIGSNVTQDGSGVATLINIDDVDICNNIVVNSARGGLYAYNVNNLKVSNLIIRKKNNVAPALYFENVDNVEVLLVDGITKGEGLKLYGTVKNFKMIGGKIESAEGISLVLPTTGLTLEKPSFNYTTFIGKGTINGVFDLINCYIESLDNVAVSVKKNEIKFNNTKMKGATIGLQINGFTDIQIIGGEYEGTRNNGIQITGASSRIIIDKANVITKSASPALHVLGNSGEIRILNNIISGFTGNSLRLEPSACGTVYLDNNTYKSGSLELGNGTKKNLQWA